MCTTKSNIKNTDLYKSVNNKILYFYIKIFYFIRLSTFHSLFRYKNKILKIVLPKLSGPVQSRTRTHRLSKSASCLHFDIVSFFRIRGLPGCIQGTMA